MNVRVKKRTTNVFTVVFFLISRRKGTGSQFGQFDRLTQDPTSRTACKASAPLAAGVFPNFTAAQCRNVGPVARHAFKTDQHAEMRN